jgi:hypothetical protein
MGPCLSTPAAAEDGHHHGVAGRCPSCHALASPFAAGPSFSQPHVGAHSYSYSGPHPALAAQRAQQCEHQQQEPRAAVTLHAPDDAGHSGGAGEGEGAPAPVGTLNLARSTSTPAAKAQIQLQLLGHVHNLQHELATVSDNPLLGLQEAAELLTDHLGVDLVA